MKSEEERLAAEVQAIRHPSGIEGDRDGLRALWQP